MIATLYVLMNENKLLVVFPPHLCVHVTVFLDAAGEAGIFTE